MSYVNGNKLTMKVVINKLKSKLLFAEANSHVVDILLRFLTLPLGKIVQILNYHYGDEAPVLGCLTDLYGDLFNRANFSAGDSNSLLFMGSIPLETECRKVIHNVTNSDDHFTQYLCRSSSCPFSGIQNISIYSDLGICVCCEEPLLDANGGNFSVVSTSFLICDDLRFVANVSGFSQMLKSLGVTETEGAEILNFNLGINEVMDLLKFSLISTTPLTDLVFNNVSETRFTAVEHVPGILTKGYIYSDDQKMILKVSLQKSTNKFLFAEASDEFVRCVFSFLGLPLGGVEYLFGGKASLQNIDNLYRSVTDGVGDEIFTSLDIKNRLINPNISHGYFSNCKYDVDQKQNTFIVSDDLSVIPSSVERIISTLNGLGIPLSDVKEMDVRVGMEEALRILKASLTWKTCLSDALINPILNRKPVVEVEPVKATTDSDSAAVAHRSFKEPTLSETEPTMPGQRLMEAKIELLRANSLRTLLNLKGSTSHG